MQLVADGLDVLFDKISVYVIQSKSQARLDSISAAVHKYPKRKHSHFVNVVNRHSLTPSFLRPAVEALKER